MDEGTIFTSDWSLVTGMAGGLEQLVSSESRKQRMVLEQPQNSCPLLTLACRYKEITRVITGEWGCFGQS